MKVKGLRVVGMAVAVALTVAGCVDKEKVETDELVNSNADVKVEEPAMNPVEDGSRDARLRALDNQIRSMVGVARADSIDQCRMIAVGKRACGGPEYYIAYSLQVTDEKALQQLVSEYTQLRIEHIQETGEMGTCEVIPEPVLDLNGGICRALSTNTM
ncbi:MAG: hypothetical protein GYB30_03460 [Gammaproteobacteria bacterium]|jgi:hypothetical protein|nr:hypothetical protein [Gammaproteobacteria bacterium]